MLVGTGNVMLFPGKHFAFPFLISHLVLSRLPPFYCILGLFPLFPLSLLLWVQRLQQALRRRMFGECCVGSILDLQILSGLFPALIPSPLAVSRLGN